jgi:hypothetical protein
MVSDLGQQAPSPAIAESFRRALDLQGTSHEALAAGTGPFHPSPAPSSATTTTSGLTAAPALTGLPALDLTSLGDDDSSLPAGSGYGLQQAGALSVEQLIQATRYLPGNSIAAGGSTAGQRALAAAASAVGVTEDPPGSNDGAGLATFRASVAGAAPGEPWCAYFASWAAAQAGTPLGDGGRGIGSAEGIAEWAGRTGRLLPAGATPSPGDLVLFGSRHVGIVESVNADGTLTTVEGNYRNAVAQVRRSPLEATGYVRLS